MERYEADLSPAEWRHLQSVVQMVSGAVARATGAIRMYVACLGSPERNPHVHVHVCPCPADTPFEQQQFATINPPDGTYLSLTDAERERLAAAIIAELRDWTYHLDGDSGVGTSSRVMRLPASVAHRLSPLAAGTARPPAAPRQP